MMVPMESIFGEPFESLEPKHVEGFLAGESGEGLIWEGKGTAPLTKLKSQIYEGVCGLGNQLGGFLLVGAEFDKKAGTWSFPGVENDCKEDAHDWIARVIQGNLVEPPPFRVRRWILPEGRLAAAVNVQQTAIPPIMTKGGVVWLRVVGETRKVIEPVVLADLIRKGEAARAAAEEKALKVVQHVQLPGELLWVALALVPTASRPDFSGRIFTPGFKTTLILAADELEVAFEDEGAPSETTVSRDGYVVARGSQRPGTWLWWLRALWNGAILVEFSTPRRASDRDPRPPPIDWIVTKAWRAAAAPLVALTGIPDVEHAPTHMALATTWGFQFHPPAGSAPVDVGATAGRPIQRWTTMAPPSNEEVESVKRELARSGAFEVFESQETPEPNNTSASRGSGAYMLTALRKWGGRERLWRDSDRAEQSVYR
jgi:hypothetical protein